MKSILIGLVALASLAPAATVAHAETASQLQMADWYGGYGGGDRYDHGWDGRDWGRHEGWRHSQWRRREEWRRWHHRCHLERFVRYDFYGRPVVETYRVCRD